MSRLFLNIDLLGAIDVRGGSARLGARDFGGVKPKQVLEILLLARGRPVPKDRLADMLWGEALPKNVGGALETYVSVLRRRLAPEGRRGHELVITEPDAYRFAVEEIDLDLDRFDRLLIKAAESDARSARRCLEDALALARGDLIEDEPYAEWVLDLRDVYSDRVLQVMLGAADAALADDDDLAGLAHAQAAISKDRFNERAHRTAMVAYYALGRQHEALATFDRCRSMLADELEVEPMPETQALHAAIRRQVDPRELRPVALQTRAPRAPKRDKPESSELIGRSAELAEIEEEIQRALTGTPSLVLIEGEVGVGKSRLLAEAERRFPSVRVGRSRCLELERDLPYVPLAMALRNAFGSVPDVLEELPALRNILPELLLSNPTLEPRVNGLESVVELIRRHAPFVLVIDDMHWADRATVAAIGYLERRCQGVPFAFLGSGRSNELSPELPLRRLEPTLRIQLESLEPAELESYGIPDLYEKTGGYPSFVVAALSLGSTKDLASDLAETTIARCRSEGPFAYQILGTASVLGAPFAPEVLAAMLGDDLGRVAAELERLCDRRLLQTDGPGFRFRYELMREILCRGMSPTRRRLVRRRALEELEAYAVDDAHKTEGADPSGVDDDSYAVVIRPARDRRLQPAILDALAVRRELGVGT